MWSSLISEVVGFPFMPCHSRFQVVSGHDHLASRMLLHFFTSIDSWCFQLISGEAHDLCFNVFDKWMFLVQGHRAYLGHRKHIVPNKRQMIPHFLNSTMPVDEFEETVRALHVDAVGSPIHRTNKSQKDVLAYPVPECMCQNPAASSLSTSSWSSCTSILLPAQPLKIILNSLFISPFFLVKLMMSSNLLQFSSSVWPWSSSYGAITTTLHNCIAHQQQQQQQMKCIMSGADVTWRLPTSCYPMWPSKYLVKRVNLI